MKRQVFMAALALGATAAPVPGHAQLALQRPTIVLVHGGFVDGSGWQGVYKILRKDGYTVRIVQNPTISLAGDVAATRLIVDAQEGRVLLVGHSYGGLVVTDDRMIPPAAQRFMSKRAGSTVRESPGSHAIYVSRPAPVVALIEQAARTLATTSR